MPDSRQYLMIERFIASAVDARALGSALELGMIDVLQQGPATTGALARRTGSDEAGANLLLALLSASGVVEVNGEQVKLTAPFVDALRYRDLLEAKIEFAQLVAPDFIGHFSALLIDPPRFMREARLFELFDYRWALIDSPENRRDTWRWMRFTTVLTKYEGAACFDCFDVGGCRRMLDIGGNSGEFALQACRRNPRLRATVFDLPVVCRLGREHLAGEPEAPRIEFIEGNALTDPLPGGFDLVCFKSMLHDWPEDAAGHLLARAAQCLAPGGTLLIFERGPIDVTGRPPTWSMMPMLLFFRSFRPPLIYTSQLERLGFIDISTRPIELETAFFLVTARRAG
jgi:SAM-dependent methyltransferase